MNNEFVCTLVSIFPFEIRETKPGLLPPYYNIPASENGEIQVVHIRSSRFHVYQRDDRQIQVNVSPDDVAKSIVQDFCASQLGYSDDSREFCSPGIFYVLGQYTAEQIQEQFASMVELARERQRNWLEALCRIADDDWQKFHQHNVISRVQRVAANLLNLSPTQHPWMDATLSTAPLFDSPCPACGTNNRPDIAICPTCKCVLNDEKYQALSFAV